MIFPQIDSSTHFREVAVKVVGLFHLSSCRNVIDQSFRYVRCNTQAPEVGSESSAKIVQPPMRYGAKFIESFLALRPAVEGPRRRG